MNVHVGVSRAVYAAASAASMVVVSAAMPVKRSPPSSSETGGSAAGAGSSGQSTTGDSDPSVSDKGSVDSRTTPAECFLKFPIHNDPAAVGHCSGKKTIRSLRRMRENEATKQAGKPVDLGKFAVGFVDEVDMIASRGDAVFDLAAQNQRFVCGRHRRQYGKQWRRSPLNVPRKEIKRVERYLCNMRTVSGMQPAHGEQTVLKREDFLNKADSELIFRSKGILVPGGTRKLQSALKRILAF